MKNVSDKICRQNQNTHFMFNMFPRNRAVYEIKSKKYGGAKNAADVNMTHARCIQEE
jgi:hypothetical protein